MIPCPNCAGGLRFDIESQQMACDHCDSRFDPAALDYKEKDEAKSTQMYDSFVYVCSSCGAELLTIDETDAIGYCPFCGGASMLFDRVHQQWRPDYVIPFQITKDQCKELYVKAAKRSVFTSKKYRDPALIDEFRGIYMPFWEYQAIQKGEMTIQGNANTPFNIHEGEVSSAIDRKVEGYAHDASVAFDDRISENIVPYDPAGHKPFAPGYLSGFYADIGDVGSENYAEIGREAIIEETVKEIADAGIDARHGYINLTPTGARIPTEVTGAKRVLYPVWFMGYRNKDRITYATVNGQTGKVSADFPVSPLRILLAVLLLGAVFFALFFILPSIKANMTLGITAVLLLFGQGILDHTYKLTVNPKTGLDQTEEAKRFEKFSNAKWVLVIFSFIAGIIVTFIDPAYNILSYSLSIGLAVELFLLMFSHIRFQVAIAKRRPPQFNKKGADS